MRRSKRQGEEKAISIAVGLGGEEARPLAWCDGVTSLLSLSRCCWRRNHRLLPSFTAVTCANHCRRGLPSERPAEEDACGVELRAALGRRRPATAGGEVNQMEMISSVGMNAA